MQALVLLFIAYGLSEFISSGKTHTQKSLFQWRGYIKTTITRCLVFIILLHPFFSGKLLTAVCILAGFYILTDIIYYTFNGMNKNPMAEIGAYVGKILLEIAAILALWGFIDFKIHSGLVSFMGKLLPPKAGQLWLYLFGGIKAEEVLVSILVYLYVIYGGALFIRKILDIPVFKLRERQNVTEIKKTGYYLGMLERALIITFTVLNALSAVAFVLTAKSIARFSELNDKDFAEYYLAGTLLSVFMGVLGGLFLKFMFIRL